MSLNRGWTFAVSAVVVAVSLSSAFATPSVTEPCHAEYVDCMIIASYEGDPFGRELAERQCQQNYDNCYLQSYGYCGDGYCHNQGGENCSSCAGDCTAIITTDKGTVTRNCQVVPDAVYPDFLAGGIQDGGYCYYRVYQDYASVCESYRITETYNTCGNPPYTTQETYEGTTKSFHSRVQVGWEPRFGPCTL
ncbi:hypothetical protein [Corallococcus macrosporus]|uniref:Lipoprotein n=1 Tax=Corallococcus macrosporus DSM 14697 TaxID=1189310 RepID=A0A250JUX2_9BACT|nr:hypothetical protein [Corallococcus macrosporus]ATB47468.1 hypothetical protein MYMAC_003082 [Corallococcus macrosporus DSM 14697]